jgi:hypothetical protein
VALAIKRSSGIKLEKIADVVDLGPEDPIERRQTRWGLDATIERNGNRLRLLIVHMKSRCVTEPIQEPSPSDHCPALARQLPHLKAWVAQAKAAGGAFIVLGDFNRNLDHESPAVLSTDMWDVITGATTPTDDDDVKLVHVPTDKEFKCWPAQPDFESRPIDFFVLNEGAAALVDASSYWKWRYAQHIADDVFWRDGPSDHCPIQLNLRFP